MGLNQKNSGTTDATQKILNNEKQIKKDNIFKLKNNASISQNDLQEVLYFISQKGWATGNKSFFPALAKFLGDKLKMEFVFINELMEPSSVKTLCAYSHGKNIDNFEYKLEYTPCENVINGNLCIYNSNIQELFPQDTILKEMGAESYIGIPLWNSKNQAIGLIALIGESPLINSALAESILQIVAVRAAAELERHRTEATLKDTIQKYQSLTETTSDLVWETDPLGNYTYASPQFKNLLGYEPEWLKGKSLVETMPAYEKSRISLFLQKHIKAHKAIHGLEKVILHKEGHKVILESNANPVFDEKGIFCGFRGIDRDITARKAIEEKFKKSHKTLTTVLDSLDALVYVAHLRTHKILFMNGRLKNIIGDATGKTCWKYIRKGMKAPCDDCSWFNNSRSAGKSEHLKERFSHSDQKWYHVRDRMIPWSDGEMVRLEIATDITELKKVEQEYEHLSFMDHLTGIGNRRSFEARFTNEWQRARRDKKPISVIMIDIDFFKQYNDRFGHPEGDSCLRRVARVIDENLKRPGDTVFRYGGEEFIICLNNTNSEGALKLAEKIRKMILAEKIPHPDSSVTPHLTISSGISTTIPQDKERPSSLIKKADRALYRAKKSGRNRSSAF